MLRVRPMATRLPSVLMLMRRAAAFAKMSPTFPFISFAFFIYPIGASGIDPGRIDFKRGANRSTTPFFEGGLHLN